MQRYQFVAFSPYPRMTHTDNENLLFPLNNFVVGTAQTSNEKSCWLWQQGPLSVVLFLYGHHRFLFVVLAVRGCQSFYILERVSICDDATLFLFSDKSIQISSGALLHFLFQFSGSGVTEAASIVPRSSEAVSCTWPGQSPGALHGASFANPTHF